MTDKTPKVSVVFQGPLSASFSALLSSSAFLRENLPGVEIVFSGWEGELTEEQKKSLGGTVVESEDPGPTYLDPVTGVQHNVRRQVRSTYAGLKATTGKFVAKLRSDVVINNLNFFKNLKDGYIRVLDIGTRDPAKMPYLFHVSDMIQIGPRAMMLDLWNFSGEYEKHEPMKDILLGKIFLGQTGLRCTRLSVEQEVLLNWMRRSGQKASLRWIDQNSFEMAMLSEQWVSGHFRVMPYADSGVVLPARITSRFRKDWCYTQETLDKVAALNTVEFYKPRYAQIKMNRLLLCVKERLFIKRLILAALYPFIMAAKSVFPDLFAIKKK